MPLRELERLAAVNRFLKLEISKDKELQEIVELAAKICGTPTALITLIMRIRSLSNSRWALNTTRLRGRMPFVITLSNRTQS